MKICKLNVYTIQKYPDKAALIIEKMKKKDTKDTGRKDAFIEDFSSRLSIGNKTLKTYFDAAYFSPNKDTLILLMQGGKITSGRFRTMLEDQDITDYTSIKSNMIKLDPPELDNKEVYFIKNEEALNNALNDSVNDTCEYYPNVRGDLVLEFPADIVIARLPIKGVIILDDKIILLLDQKLKENLKFEDVIRVLSKKSIIPSIKEEINLPDEDYKRLVKEQ